MPCWPTWRRGLTVLSHAHLPLPGALRSELLALNSPGEDELHRAALAANALSRVYAEAIARAAEGRRRYQRPRSGPWGHTARPCAIGRASSTAVGYTIQLLNPALLAELVGIDVVADFRSRDVAAGGQGAPLVPAFHRALFARPGETVAVLNLGGIANLTVLEADWHDSGIRLRTGQLC